MIPLTHLLQEPLQARPTLLITAMALVQEQLQLVRPGRTGSHLPHITSCKGVCGQCLLLKPYCIQAATVYAIVCITSVEEQ